jgi:hypothetical protein
VETGDPRKTKPEFPLIRVCPQRRLLYGQTLHLFNTTLLFFSTERKNNRKNGVQNSYTENANLPQQIPHIIPPFLSHHL